MLIANICNKLCIHEKDLAKKLRMNWKEIMWFPKEGGVNPLVERRVEGMADRLHKVQNPKYADTSEGAKIHY